MQYIIYGNGGSGNHGCEAIARGTKALLGGAMRIHSASPEQDARYGLGRLGEIVTSVSDKKRDFLFLKAYAKMKLTGDYTDMDGLGYLPEIQKAKSWGKLALSAGGDNYCYPGTEIYGYLNCAYHKNGFKTVLWGCSVEPGIVQQPSKAKDLRRYDLIVARESITYEAVKRIGANAILVPDPAFFMETEPCQLDTRFLSGDVIGINASPHILKCAGDSSIAYENYRTLIQYILTNTDAYIALIPHVVWDSNDDRKVLRRLYDDFNQDERLILVEDHCAPELKYIISKCCFFVGARTHATIAAYSSCVPTLVVGYSVKARGIARDLFGTEEGYVLPVQKMTNSSQLTKAFQELYRNRLAIIEHLENMLHGYSAENSIVKKAIRELI